MSHTRYTPRPLPAESATAYLRQGLNRAKHPITIVIDAPATTVIDAFKYQDAEVHSLTPTRTSITLATDSWQYLLLNLAFLDINFHFTSPPPSPPTSEPSPTASFPPPPDPCRATSRAQPAPRIPGS